MEYKDPKNLIIVRNANSTRHERINSLVLDPLNERGIHFSEYETEYPDTEANIAAMQEHIPSNATVIAAAGDGTAMQLVNAAVRGRKNWTLGFMPLGNFNDHAKSRARREYTAFDLIAADTVATHPMRIEVDGSYLRHASAYMTIGWTALAASQFGSLESRQAMKDMPDLMKLAKSLGQVAGNHLKNRKTLLPAFEVNGMYQDGATDIIAANSPRIASIVRSKDPYYDKSYFGMRADINVSDYLASASFGLQAVSGHAPFDHADEMRIIFEQAATVPFQTEGEFQWLNAEEVFIYKDPSDAIRVLHPKSSKRK